MKQVYVARDPAEAHLIAEMLSAAGIAAQVQGEHISTLQGAVPFGTATAPSVWVVDNSDAVEARHQINQLMQNRQSVNPQLVWVCPECREVIESQFTACWSCGAERGDAPFEPASRHAIELTDEENESAAEDLRSTGQPLRETPTGATLHLWIETVVVLSFAVFPGVFTAIASLFLSEQPVPHSFVYDQVNV